MGMTNRVEGFGGRGRGPSRDGVVTRVSTGTERMVDKVYSERTISFDFIRREKPDGSDRHFVETK